MTAGRSFVDQKAISGESVPIAKHPGDEVYAGTINGDGTLDVEATAPLTDSLLAQTRAMVDLARQRPADIERSIDRFARYYTPLAVCTAILLMLGPPLFFRLSESPGDWADWFRRGLVLLVVSCPCALVIGTPVAVVNGLVAASRRGILIKGGQFLEAVGRLKVIAFDKTGTLTLGSPAVVEIVPAPPHGVNRLLQVAAALGDRGAHLLGRAIADHARANQVVIPAADDYQAVPGLGASATVEGLRYHLGNLRFIDESGQCTDQFHATLATAERDSGTAVVLSTAAGPLGWIRLVDQPRPEAAEVLNELTRLGIRHVMLTGDNSSTASAIAHELGVSDHRAELLPADKATAITTLETELGPTGMVGDGVNDAPALATAQVSVALGGISSGVALETADVVLMADDLRGLPWLIRHSRRTLRMIRENIIIALVAKGLVVGLAAFGLADLWMAIAADVGTTLLVVTNSLRLLRTST